MEPAEIRLLDPLPLFLIVPDVRLARVAQGSSGHGTAPRRLLRGLLLDLDGVAVRLSGDEPAVDRRTGRVRVSGESFASGPSLGPSILGALDSLGHLGRRQRGRLGTTSGYVEQILAWPTYECISDHHHHDTKGWATFRTS